MQCYLQKLKKIRASLIQSMYFYMVIVEAIQCRIVLFPTPTVITIYIITLQKKTNNFSSPSFRTFKTVTVTLWSKIAGFERWRRTNADNAITESRTAFAAFLRITLTSLMTSLLFTVLQVTDLLAKLAHWIFWTGIGIN